MMTVEERINKFKEMLMMAEHIYGFTVEPRFVTEIFGTMMQTRIQMTIVPLKDWSPLESAATKEIKEDAPLT